MKQSRLPVPWLTAAIVVALNLLVIVGFLWSRGGQTTHIRVEARGDTFTVFVDGKEAMSQALPGGPDDGGIALAFGDQRGIPSLPGPTGVDSVRVTDLDSKAVLLDESFDGAAPARDLSVTEGTEVRRDGVLIVGPRTTLERTDAAWRNIAVDVTYKNIGPASIHLRRQRSQDAVSDIAYTFEGFRNPVQRLIVQPPGGAPTIVTGPPLEFSRAATLKSMIAMSVRPYFLAMALIVAGCAVVAGSRWLPAWSFPDGSRPWSRVKLTAGTPWYVVGAAALAAFAVTLFLDYRVSAHISHWPDSTSYIFQAKVFASGHMAAPEPPAVPSFDFFYPPLTLVTDGRWSTIFPFGHPLLLAIGERAGAVWLVPPIVGAACVVLLFAAGRKMYGVRTGIIAAALLVTSPFFLMQASNFMSHNTAMLYLLITLLCVLTFQRRPLLMGAIAGLSFGLLFNTRPLTAVALVLPLGVLLCTHLRPREMRAAGAKHLAAFVGGALAMLVAYFLYSYGTTGDLFSSNYQSRDAGQFGFGGAHSVAVGIQNEQANLAFLLLVLDGWPQYVGLMFLLLPFLLGTRNAWDWFCLACAVLVIAANVLFSENGVMEGPRFWYEAVPFLLFLTARGAERAADVFLQVARRFRARTASPDERARFLGEAMVYGCLAALMAGSVYGWLLGRHASWKVESIPETASALRDFNGVDTRMQVLVDQRQLHHALVLVDDCPHWQCYGSVFTLNTPKLDGDVVFAKNIPDFNARVFAAYADRTVYRANYQESYLVPWGADVSTRAKLVAAGGAKAPLASEVLATLPTPAH